MSLSAVVRHLVGTTESAQPDSELLARFLATRDEGAFAALVERHAAMVTGVCRRILGHAQDAEDAAQAVFLVLAKNARRVRKPSALAAWLHGVAVRVSRKALACRPKAEPLPQAVPATESADPSWADARRVIDEALAALPESLRLPLVLCYLKGLTRDEAATRLGLALDTFRGRLERGREKLRAALARRGFPLAAGLLAVLLESPASAAPGWSAATTALAVGTSATSPSPAVASLTTGVLPVKSLFVPVLGVLCLVALAAGMFALVQKKNEKNEPAPNAPPVAEKLFAPDPKAPPVDKKLAGVWRSTVTSPDGTATRITTLRFVDGKHLVWQVHLRSPGVDTTATLRGTYELKADGELIFEVKAKWNGEEPLPVNPDEALRKYTMAWQQVLPAGFTLRPVTATGDLAPVQQFRLVKEEKEDATASVPAALDKLDRTIKKEPKYAGTPRYLLLAFGPEAQFLVWVVLDGTTVYVDRNGNGDLTDDGEKFDQPNAVLKNPIGEFGGVLYSGIELTEPTETKHTNLTLHTMILGFDTTYAKITVNVGGKTEQLAGLTDLWFAGSAKEAQVIHFGGKEIVAEPQVSPRFALLSADRADEFQVQVGTPGIGAGSFASFVNKHLPEGIGPIAEFEFTPLEAGAPTKKMTVKLIDRCCENQFVAKVAVPDGVKTGVNAAKVTLSFPNCPWGKVEPVTYPVDVTPKQK